jgi:hypothetical protein
MPGEKGLTDDCESLACMSGPVYRGGAGLSSLRRAEVRPSKDEGHGQRIDRQEEKAAGLSLAGGRGSRRSASRHWGGSALAGCAAAGRCVAFVAACEGSGRRATCGGRGARLAQNAFTASVTAALMTD